MLDWYIERVTENQALDFSESMPAVCEIVVFLDK
jgi:hypothetical protein